MALRKLYICSSVSINKMKTICVLLPLLLAGGVQAGTCPNYIAPDTYWWSSGDGLNISWPAPGYAFARSTSELTERVMASTAAAHPGWQLIPTNFIDDWQPVQCFRLLIDGNEYSGNAGICGYTGAWAQFRHNLMCPEGYTWNGGFCALDSDTNVCPDPEKDGGESDICGEGNPINPARGLKYEISEDIHLSGSPLGYSRYYAQRPTKWGGINEVPIGSIGVNWRGSYDVAISKATDSLVFVYRPDGKVLRFTWNGMAWAADSDVVTRLYEVRDGNGKTVSWRYLTRDNVLEEFDAAGRILRRFQSGNFLSFTYYNEAGALEPADAPICENSLPASPNQNSKKIVCVTDNFGKQLKFNYDLAGRVISIVLPDGATTRYTYGEKSNLTSVIFLDGRAKTYLYNEPSLTSGNYLLTSALTGIVDENGSRYATFSYDSSGKAISTEHAGGVEKYQLSYGPTGTVITDPLGTQRTQSFQTVLGVVKSTGVSQPGGAGCSAAASAQTYDANGNIASRTDFNGVQTTYTYDLSRNLETQRIEAVGKPEARTINTQWHGYWRLPTQQAEPNKRTTWVYNGDLYQGSTVTCAPSNATVPSINGGTQPIGVLCRKIEQATTDATGSQGFSAGATGTARISSWTYNQYGQVLTADGPRTDAADLTTYTYYDAVDPDMGKRSQLASLTNALGHVTQITAYDGNGNPLTILDPNGVTTTLTYDARQRLTSRSVGTEQTSYQYDGVGQLTRITLPDGSSLAYTYDAAHRLTDLSDSLGNQIHYTLDAMGNRVKEDVKDPQGTLARTKARAYDALNRLQTLTGVGE